MPQLMTRISCAYSINIELGSIMLKNNIYNIDMEFDYATVKDIVLKSLEKIIKEEAFKNISNIRNDIISDCEGNGDPKNINLLAPLVLKRDNFTCQVCSTCTKDNKSLRLEVHHANRFDDICIENGISTVEQALTCKELWNLNNGVSICYGCHKDIEKLRTKLKYVCG
jgi:hypothetical protein